MPSNITTPFSPSQFQGWASFFQGNVVQAPPPPPSAFGASALGGQPPPSSGQYTGGWAYPDAWANFYEGKQGFTAPQNQNSASGALGALNYARNINNPNDPNLLGWERVYGNPQTILQQDQNWAQSLGDAPTGTPSNQLTGGWQNPAAWAAFYGGTNGFTQPANAGSPASALAAASQIAKTSSPQDNPALLGWVQDYGQPGSVLANTPNWAASLGSPQVNASGQGVGQTNTQGWDSPLAWAAYYGGFQGYKQPVDNTLQAAQNWAGVTNQNDPSLLGWTLDYGDPQTVVSTIQASPEYQAYLAAIAEQQRLANLPPPAPPPAPAPQHSGHKRAIRDITNQMNAALAAGNLGLYDTLNVTLHELEGNPIPPVVLPPYTPPKPVTVNGAGGGGGFAFAPSFSYTGGGGTAPGFINVTPTNAPVGGGGSLTTKNIVVGGGGGAGQPVPGLQSIYSPRQIPGLNPNPTPGLQQQSFQIPGLQAQPTTNRFGQELLGSYFMGGSVVSPSKLFNTPGSGTNVPSFGTNNLQGAGGQVGAFGLSMLPPPAGAAVGGDPFNALYGNFNTTFRQAGTAGAVGGMGTPPGGPIHPLFGFHGGEGGTSGLGEINFNKYASFIFGLAVKYGVDPVPFLGGTMTSAMQGLIPFLAAPGDEAPVTWDVSGEPQANVNVDDFGRIIPDVGPPEPFNLPDFGGLEQTVQEVLGGSGWMAPERAITPAAVDDLGRPIPDIGSPQSFSLPGFLRNLLTPFSPAPSSPQPQQEPASLGGGLAQQFVSEISPTSVEPTFAQIPNVTSTEPDFAQVPQFTNEPTFAQTNYPLPADVFIDPTLGRNGPNTGFGASTLYGDVGSEKGGYAEPVWQQGTQEPLPPGPPLTAAETFVQKMGGRATLYQLAQSKGGDGAQKMQENRSMLGEGVFTTPLDLSQPLEPQIRAIIGGTGMVAGQVIAAMKAEAPSPAVQQRLMDVAADAQQDIQEGPGAYGPTPRTGGSYTTVPIYGDINSGIPSYGAPGDFPRPPANVPNTPAAPPRPPGSIPDNFAQGSPFAGAPGQDLSYTSQPTFQFAGGTGTAKNAPDGNPPVAFIIHTTDQRYPSAEALVQDWKTDPDPQRHGVGSTYIMDRNGQIYRSQEDLGYSGNENFHNSIYPGVNNGTTVSMEFIAKNDADITPQMRQAGIDFINSLYGDIPALAHSQVSPGDRTNEGESISNAIGRVPPAASYMPLPQPRPTGDVGSGSMFYPAPPSSSTEPVSTWDVSGYPQIAQQFQGGPLAGAPGQDLSYTPGTLGFLHGMQSRYQQYGGSVQQVEADARAVAEQMGYNFRVIGGSADNPAAQMAALKQALDSGYDISALLGFSGGASAVNALAGQYGIPGITVAGPGPQDGFNVPGASHMNQIAMYGDMLADQSGEGFGTPSGEIGTPLSGIDYLAPKAQLGPAALHGAGGPTAAENLARLHPQMLINLELGMKALEEAGYGDVIISSGYRDPNALRETNQAPHAAAFDAAGKSIHSTGAAVDFDNMGTAGSARAIAVQQILAQNGIIFPYGVNDAAEFNHAQLAGTNRVPSAAGVQLNLQGAPMEQRWQALGIPLPTTWDVSGYPQQQDQQSQQIQRFTEGMGPQEANDEVWFNALQQAPIGNLSWLESQPLRDNFEEMRAMRIPAAEPESADFIWDNAEIGPQGQTGTWGTPTSAPPIGQGYGGGPQEFAPVSDIGQMLAPLSAAPLKGGEVGPQALQWLTRALSGYFNPPAPTFDRAAAGAEAYAANLVPHQLNPTSIPSLPGGTGGFAPEAFGGGYNPPADIFAAADVPTRFQGGPLAGTPSPFSSGLNVSALTHGMYPLEGNVFAGQPDPGTIYAPNRASNFGDVGSYVDPYNKGEFNLKINPTGKSGYSTNYGGVSMPWAQGYENNIVLVQAPNGEWQYLPIADIGPNQTERAHAELDVLNASLPGFGYEDRGQVPSAGWLFQTQNPRGGMAGPPIINPQGGPYAGQQWFAGQPAAPILRFTP